MIKLNRAISLNDLAEIIDVEIRFISKNNSTQANLVHAIAPIDLAMDGEITFLANPIYVKHLANTKATAVIISPKYLAKCPVTALVTNNPRLALAKLLQLCVKPVINRIHPSSVIADNVIIGNNVNIEAGVVIGENCIIGDNVIIKPNVVLYDNVKIGNNCIIHSNTVLGSDGFGYAQNNSGCWVKMPHLGGVIIEDNVEIGSNTSVDRGCIGDTIIKQGVIIDNLVQVAHNVIIGENTAIAGCVAIAGSAVIGKNCLIGGAASIAGHLIITDNVHITATSAVNNSIPVSGVYSSGFPVSTNLSWKKNVARFNSLAKTIKDLFTKIKNLEDKINL